MATDQPLLTVGGRSIESSVSDALLPSACVITGHAYKAVHGIWEEAMKGLGETAHGIVFCF